MENPTQEIETVIYKLTTGSPRLQQQAIEHYFTPNASFTHPFCAVTGNRNHLLSIFRWYKILSPEIKIQVNGVSHEEARQKLYVDISQTFRLWPLIPLGYAANVNLVTVLQLTRDPSGRDRSAERAIISNSDSTPSFGSNALPAATTSPFTADGKEKSVTTLPSTTEPTKYWIKSQNDLYQVPEFSKFASLLGLLPMVISLWHMIATWCCILGALIFAPFSAAMQRYSDKQVEHRARVRSHSAFGPSIGGDGERLKARDVWELEAKYLGGGVSGDVGKMEGLKMKMMKTEGKNGDVSADEPVLNWMKMEGSAAGGR